MAYPTTVSLGSNIAFQSTSVHSPLWRNIIRFASPPGWKEYSI